MKESNVTREIWREVGMVSCLFRVNSGQAWVGAGPPKRFQDGSVLLTQGRPIALGFSGPDTKPVAGVGDMIGWTPVVVTPDMVGQTVAVFTSIEAKASTGGKKGAKQLPWADLVRRAGGIAGFARSGAEALGIVKSYLGASTDK